MVIPDGMTYLDAYGNFNVLRAIDMGRGVQLSQGKAYVTEVDLRNYSPRFLNGETPNRLLDHLTINADSPNTLFSLMRTCVCFFLSDPTESELNQIVEGKADFFRMTRESRAIALLPNIQISVEDTQITLVDITAAFNPAALALLSLPAYFVMDFSSYATLSARNKLLGRKPLYACLAPPAPMKQGPAHIQTLDDYMEAFHFGNFIGNNSDAWISIYGLAYCFAAFIQSLRHNRIWERAYSIREIVHYEPFIWIYERLTHIGALKDPFDRSSIIWTNCSDGIWNAREVSQPLYSCLSLAEMLQPVPLTTVYPGLIQSIFYGIVDLFDIRDYFGISSHVNFDYPE